MSEQQDSGFLKLEVKSLDEVIIRPDSLMLVADNATKSGLILPDSAVSGMKFFVERVGENVTEYKKGDEIIYFNTRSAIPCIWKNKKVFVIGKYDINIAARHE